MRVIRRLLLGVRWPRSHASLNSMKIGEDSTSFLNGDMSEQEAVYDLAERCAEVTEADLRRIISAWICIMQPLFSADSQSC